MQGLEMEVLGKYRAQKIEDLENWRTWGHRGPGEIEDLGKWRTWGARGHEKMDAGLEKWRTWVNRGPGKMDDLGKWRTWEMVEQRKWGALEVQDLGISKEDFELEDLWKCRARDNGESEEIKKRVLCFM